MPLKRKRKTETELNEQTGADGGSEETLVAQPAGASAPLAQGPSAWNLDAFAPYQAEGKPAAPFAEDASPGTPERTDVYPNGLMNGINRFSTDEPEKTDVLDLDQLAQMPEPFASSPLDRTLISETPAQFETTAAYDFSLSHGLSEQAETPAPELEPMPSIFASFQEQANMAPLFDDSLPAQTFTPSFDALPVAPPDETPVFEPTAPSFEQVPIAPVFADLSEPPLINTTQRFTPDDLGLPAPPDAGVAPGMAPSYTGAQTFAGSPLHEPDAGLAAAPASAGRLIVRLGRFSASYEVDRPEILIGRPDPENEIFPEVAIEWDDAISRRHARILHRDDGDYLEDNGSTNGTKLNGIPLSPHDPQRLYSGDLIHVGSKTEIMYYA